MTIHLNIDPLCGLQLINGNLLSVNEVEMSRLLIKLNSNSPILRHQFNLF